MKADGLAGKPAVETKSPCPTHFSVAPSGVRLLMTAARKGLEDRVPVVVGSLQDGECWISVSLAPPVCLDRAFSADNGTVDNVQGWGPFSKEPRDCPCRLTLVNRSPVTVFSPKLWTALNQYGTAQASAAGLCELPLGRKFEDFSLGRIPSNLFGSGGIADHVLVLSLAASESKADLGALRLHW
jgi:hypothetical protein